MLGSVLCWRSQSNKKGTHDKIQSPWQLLSLFATSWQRRAGEHSLKSSSADEWQVWLTGCTCGPFTSPGEKQRPTSQSKVLPHRPPLPPTPQWPHQVCPHGLFRKHATVPGPEYVCREPTIAPLGYIPPIPAAPCDIRPKSIEPYMQVPLQCGVGFRWQAEFWLGASGTPPGR